MNPNQTELPPPAQMMQMIAGSFVAKSIAVAAELRLAEHLSRAPATAEQLAKEVSVDASVLYRLLRALASQGVFQEHEGGRFSNTALSETLRSDVPGSMNAMAQFLCGDALWSAWGELARCVRHADSGFVRVHKEHPFAYMQGHADLAGIFDRAMTGLSEQETIAIHASFDFSEIGTLVDIAGGQGSLLLSCLQKNPTQRGILFDRPNVLAQARSVVGASGVAGRCELIEGDFFKEVPSGADAYMMKYILHDWSDEESLAILRNIRRASRKGTKLLVIDPIVQPGNVPDFAKLMDLQMLVFYGTGRERTASEFDALLRAADFRIKRTVPTASAVSVIEAEAD